MFKIKIKIYEFIKQITNKQVLFKLYPYLDLIQFYFIIFDTLFGDTLSRDFGD